VEVCAAYDLAVTGPAGSSPACDVAVGLSQPQDDSANRTGIATELVNDAFESPAEGDALLVVNGKGESSSHCPRVEDCCSERSTRARAADGIEGRSAISTEVQNGQLFLALVGSSILIVFVALVFFAKQRRARPPPPHTSIFSRSPSPDTVAAFSGFSRDSMPVQRAQSGVAPSPCGATPDLWEPQQPEKVRRDETLD